MYCNILYFRLFNNKISSEIKPQLVLQCDCNSTWYLKGDVKKYFLRNEIDNVSIYFKYALHKLTLYHG